PGAQGRADAAAGPVVIVRCGSGPGFYGVSRSGHHDAPRGSRVRTRAELVSFLFGAGGRTCPQGTAMRVTRTPDAPGRTCRVGANRFTDPLAAAMVQCAACRSGEARCHAVFNRR